MKTAIIINNLIACGAERLALDEMNEMHRRGIPVSLITLRPEKTGNTFMPLCELPITARHSIHFSSVADIRAWVRLVRLLRLEKYDTVITHLWFANTIGRIAARIASVKRILSFEHNVYDDVKSWKQFIADRILQRLSHRIIAVSDAVRTSLIAHGINARSIVVIPNGIDLKRYRKATPASINTGGKFSYLFAGRLIKQKAVDVLLAAFARLDDGLLLIAGDGIDRTALEKQASELGVEERVRFLGVRDDIPALMKTAGCFVLPSRWEGMGIVLIEALASGCPVIAADFSAARGVLKDGTTGLIVPVEDAAALSASMLKVASDPLLRRKLSDAGAKDAERFSIATHIDRLLEYIV